MRIHIFLAVASLATGAAGQCADPPTPASGFAVTLVADRLVTCSDAYLTRADVRHPSVAPGACGWPLLVAVHGFPGSKGGPIAAMAADYAARGYCVVTYDVRGQGSGIALNPGRGTTLMGLHEWIDMFEVMEWVAAAFPGLVDLRRIGVFGISQGGAHAFAAAAWSGRTPPPNARRTAAFPVVNAVAPTVMVPSHTDAATLDGTAFVDAWASLAFVQGSPQVAMDAAFQAVMRTHVLADDPAGMRAWMRSDPGRDFQHLLPTSTTAVLATMAWLDESMNANRTLQAVAGMAAAAGRRVFLTTGNHGTPTNAYESARVDAVRRAWFERFLKAGSDPVEHGPAVLSACLPATAPEYLTATTLWRHRADPQFPPASASSTSYYLRQGAALSTSPPAGQELPDAVVHSVPSGYDLQAWRADGGGQNLGLALSRMPLSRVVYETPPFPSDVEIAGIPLLHLEVIPQQPRFLLAARLEVVPPAGPAQIVAQGGIGVRQTGAPTPAPVAIELGATACVVPAGARLRLSVQNHYLVKAAAMESFRYLPMFVGSRTDIEHRPGAESRLTLPVRPTVRMDVSTAATQIALAAPTPVSLEVRSAAAHAGAAYWLLCSLAGQGPPLALSATEQLHLVPDALTLAFLGATSSPLLPGFAGIFDGSGRANASMVLAPLAPLPLELAGARLHLAPLELRGGVLSAGAPLELEFR